MADLNLGTLIVSTIKQKTVADQFATFDANDGLGGLYSTTSIAGRDGIPTVRRREGMFCYVSGSGSYQLVGGISNSNWQPFSSGTGSNSLTASYALTASYYLPSSHSYVTQIGDGVNTEYVISHNLGTKNLVYSMFDVSSSNATIPDIFFINNDQVRLEFFNTVSLNQYELTLTPGNNLVNYFGSGSNATGSNLSGDYVVTASGANTNETASYALIASESISSSYALHSLTSTMASSSLLAETASIAIFADSASYALTASYALNSNTGSFGDFVITASGALTNETASFSLESNYSNSLFPTLDTVKKALDLLLYVSISFSQNPTLSTSQFETGSTATNLTLSWSYNKPNISQTVTDFSSSISSRNHLYTTSYTANKTFTVSATDERSNSVSRNTTVSFLNRIYYGTTPSSSLNNSDVLGLANKPFISSRNLNATLGGNGDYVVFCYPTSFGNGNFTADGFGTTLVQSTLSLTNNSGYTTNYYIYRTNVGVNASTNYILS